jgi:cobalt/nickel transport system permease protein
MKPKRDRWLLLGWLAAVVVISQLHDPLVLGMLLLAVMALQGSGLASALKRALAAVALINVTVSLGYAVSAMVDDRPWLEFVLRLNFRVLLLALLTIWLSRTIRLERALDFSPGLQFLVVLTQGQIRALQRLAAECRSGFASRNPTPLAIRARMRGSGRQAAALMEKAELHAEALTQGMQSRGFFDAPR